MTSDNATVEIPIERGDTINIDGSSFEVADVTDEEIQLSTPSGFIDVTKTEEEMAEKLAQSNKISIYK